MMSMSPGFAVDEKEDLLLIYDRTSYIGDIRDTVISLRELMGHFDVNFTSIDQKDYKENDHLAFDYIVVIGLEGFFDNQVMINDIASIDDKPVIWLGRGIDKVLDLGTLDFTYKGALFDLVSVQYIDHYNDNEEMIYPIGTKRRFEGVVPSDESEILSWMDDGVNKFPYALKEKNFYYFSRMDLNEPLFYIFADILHDILPESAEESQSVYLRIEDVHPFRDPELLKAMADKLYEHKIPFMVGVIPAYRSEDNSYITPLSERPEIVEALKYMQSKGGSIVLHGYTHSIFGQDITGEGFEYWDGENDQQLAIDIDEWVDYTIGNGVKECIDNGIYPLAFEAPHYAMSQAAYMRLKEYFSTYVGQVQASDYNFTTSVYPYILRDTPLFHHLIPENLGYYHPDEAEPLAEIKQNYERIQIVRTYTAGLFFHSYLSIEELEEVIALMESWEIPYFDLKDYDNWVRFEGYEVVSKDGVVSVIDKPVPLSMRDVLNQFFVGASWVLGVILVVVLTAFGIFIYRSTKKTRQKLK